MRTEPKERFFVTKIRMENFFLRNTKNHQQKQNELLNLLENFDDK